MYNSIDNRVDGNCREFTIFRGYRVCGNEQIAFADLRPKAVRKGNRLLRLTSLPARRETLCPENVGIEPHRCTYPKGVSYWASWVL